MPDKDAIYEELKSIIEDAIHSSKNLKDYWISSVGKTLYGKFVDGYSKKMWQIDDNKKIDYFHGLQRCCFKGRKERRGMKQYLHILMQLMDMMITSQYQHKMQKF